MTILELTLRSIARLARLPRWRGREHPESTDEPDPEARYPGDGGPGDPAPPEDR